MEMAIKDLFCLVQNNAELVRSQQRQAKTEQLVYKVSKIFLT